MTTMQQYYLTADITDVLDDIIPDTINDMAPLGWPGYVGVSAENSYNEAFTGRLPMADWKDNQGANIDYQSYGQMGDVNRNAYSILGPVEPNSVEDFQLYGNVAHGQRRPEYGLGPVGSYDHGDYTLLQVAQQMEREAYSEEAIISLLTGGY